jgi:hypothetical protein
MNVGSNNTKPYCHHDSSSDGFDEKISGVWSSHFLMSVVEKSRVAERVTNFVFYSRGPFCRRVLRLHSDCLISWHSYAWLIKWRCDKSAIFFLCDEGCCVTKGQNKRSLNPDGTLWGNSGIKSGFQRPVLRVQLYCATKFTFQCYSEDLKGSDEISMCVTASQKEAWIYTLFLFHFIFSWSRHF